MTKPLAGIKVIELANFIAGPLCGTLLADMGADVIKVEPPKGDMARAMPPIRNGESVSFVALNRNKRSLVLDLKRPQATEVLLKLARQSDALIEAYRPGALEKLGLGAEQVKAVNPRIVYTSVSGFGQSGPYRRRAGVNLIVEAFSGALSVTGEPGRMPMRPGVQTADVFGALFAVYATLAGLVGSGRTGEGLVATCRWSRARSRRRRGRQPNTSRPGMSRSHSATGIGSTRRTSYFRPATAATLRSARPTTGCSPILCRCSACRRMWAIPASRPIPAARPTRTRCWHWSNRRCAHADSREIEAALVAAGLPCACVNNFKEVFDDPHMIARGIVKEVEHPRLGQMRTVRNPILLDHDGPAIERYAPMLGEHSEEILRQLGYPAGAIAELFTAGVTGNAARANSAAQAAE